MQYTSHVKTNNRAQVYFLLSSSGPLWWIRHGPILFSISLLVNRWSDFWFPTTTVKVQCGPVKEQAIQCLSLDEHVATRCSPGDGTSCIFHCRQHLTNTHACCFEDGTTVLIAVRRWIALLEFQFCAELGQLARSISCIPISSLWIQNRLFRSLNCSSCCSEPCEAAQGWKWNGPC